MKKISEHLGQIIVALCGIVLCVCAIVVFRADIGAFFNNIVGKETGVGNQLLDGVNNPDFAITVDYERPVITLDQDLSEDSNNPTSIAGSVSNGNYTISGKVTDNAGVQSVTVNGTEVAVAADGTWSATVAIAQNETKEIVIFATDVSGNKASKTVHIANIEYINFTVTSSNRTKVGYTGAENEALVIPATFYDETDGKWYKVIAIDSSAFDSCTKLTSIDIPDSITNIERNVFFGCTNLTNITIPDSVTSIGTQAFMNCTNLALTSLPSGITSIGDQAFAYCTNLALTSLPESVISIGFGAFRDCENITWTSLPSGLTSIGNYAFSCCYNLALTELPSGITSIGDRAFASCYNLALTRLPSGLASIGEASFSSCKNLTSIVIPESVTSIGREAFYYSVNLRDITFEGTVEQWNAISFGLSWKSSVPATEVVCSDGTVNL